jgi:colicin import membrane protein
VKGYAADTPEKGVVKIFKPALIISAVIHLVIAAFVISAPELGFSLWGERPIKINAIFVEIPRGTSEELGTGMKKAEALPKSTIEEQKRLFQPEKLEQQSLKPKMRVPPAEENDKQKKLAKRPKVEAKTTRKNDPKMKKTKPKKRRVSRADRAIKNALAKIDRELSGRTVVPESAQIKEDGEGYKYGTSNKPLKVPISDPEYIKYQAMVRAKIIQEWIVPMKFTEDGSSNFNARLEVMINTDGDVVTVRWDSPSGHTSFDQSAVRAVKKASPFPKPPDKLAWEAYNEGFLVEFDPSLKSHY